MRKAEIEDVLDGRGDFVKIDYLTRYLKDMPPHNMKKFAYLKLAEIYEEKKMFMDAAKMYKNLAVNSLTFKDKIDYYILETKSLILAGNFDDADKALRKALNEGNSRDKIEIYKVIKEFYKGEALKLEDSRKINHAAKIYEKLLRMNLEEDEKEEVREKLIELYEKLGKRKEIEFLKRV